MDHTGGDDDVAAAEIRPPLFCQSGENFRSDRPIALPLLSHIWLPLRRSERLYDVRSAHNADELAILDDGDPLDAISLEKRGNLGQWRVFGRRNNVLRHEFRNALSV